MERLLLHAHEQHEQTSRDLQKRLADVEQTDDSVDEQELLAHITRLAEDYRRQGDAFYAQTDSAAARNRLYYGPHGLRATFQQVKSLMWECFRFEEESVTTSINSGHLLIVSTLRSFEVMLAVTIVLAGLGGVYRIRAILRPNRSAASDGKDASRDQTLFLDPAREPDFSGPICLCLVSVWLAVVSLGTCSRRSPFPVQLPRNTRSLKRDFTVPNTTFRFTSPGSPSPS